MRLPLFPNKPQCPRHVLTPDSGILSRGRSLMVIGLILALLYSIPACGPSRPRSVYPPPDILGMAETQRHEFIHLFLQGRWCEAQGMFERSVESYKLQDDFCGAAHNHLIAWKLHQYVHLEANHHLAAARELAGTGLSCPALHLPDPAADHSFADEDRLGASDLDYRRLIDQGAFMTLSQRLRSERDPLFASVYGRKAAQAALDQGELESARDLLHQTRDLNAQQGWIVFLIADWNMLLEVTTEPERRHEIQRRIVLLQERIQPCSI
ncbi:MAG: hypothetical protein EA399_13600 [Desulfovibrionales bacterium]|nr:MAG: hypothetical protein EA399_13600 [Desulfovibrionales bacterium]